MQPISKSPFLIYCNPFLKCSHCSYVLTCNWMWISDRQKGGWILFFFYRIARESFSHPLMLSKTSFYFTFSSSPSCPCPFFLPHLVDRGRMLANTSSLHEVTSSCWESVSCSQIVQQHWMYFFRSLCLSRSQCTFNIHCWVGKTVCFPNSDKCSGSCDHRSAGFSEL